MKYVIITPGGTVQYDVPIMKVQKGVGGMMSGALIETSARKIKTTAEIEKQRCIATRMLQDGELSIDKIAMYTELKVAIYNKGIKMSEEYFPKKGEHSSFLL